MNRSSIASIFLDLLFNTIQDPDTGKFAPVPVATSGTGKTPKEVAVKIAERAGPRKCYSYHEFERSHFRRLVENNAI